MAWKQPLLYYFSQCRGSGIWIENNRDGTTLLCVVSAGTETSRWPLHSVSEDSARMAQKAWGLAGVGTATGSPSGAQFSLLAGFLGYLHMVAAASHFPHGLSLPSKIARLLRGWLVSESTRAEVVGSF